MQRGRRQGWLTPDGLEEVCRFISPAKGDSMHFSGSHRCEAMRQCYTDPHRQISPRSASIPVLRTFAVQSALTGSRLTGVKRGLGSPDKVAAVLRAAGVTGLDCDRDAEMRMDKFTTLTGVAAPLPMINVDTDAIIPKQFLKTIKRTGLGKHLFYELRYDEQGKEKPDFVLNKPAYRKAQILVAGENFGCGSSREHAPWALLDFGIRCVISTVVRRHLLQQLLPERHPADQGAAGGPRQADGRRQPRRQRDAHRRSREAGDPRPRRRRRSSSTSTRSASAACSKASTTSA